MIVSAGKSDVISIVKKIELLLTDPSGYTRQHEQIRYASNHERVDTSVYLAQLPVKIMRPNCRPFNTLRILF